MELRHIFEILWRRRWIAINIFTAFFLTIMVGSLLITPWYDSTAKVLIRKSSAASSLLSGLGLQDFSIGQSATLSDTERSDYLALATLRPVVGRVISELGVTRERTRARLMRAVPFSKSVLAFLGVDVDATTKVMTAEQLIDKSLLSNIFPRPYVKVDQYEDTDIFEIEAISSEPEQAMQIANAMARFFIEDEIKRVRKDYKRAKPFIDESLKISKKGYINALNSLKLFKEKRKTVDLETETSNLVQKISNLKTTLDDNNLAIHNAEASINSISTQLESVPKYQKVSEQIKQNEMIINLKLSLRDLYLALSETKTKYRSEHPNVIDIENKIEKAKELLQKEVEKVFSSATISIDSIYQDFSSRIVENYVAIAVNKAQYQVLHNLIQKYESEMMSLPDLASKYSKLLIDVKVTENAYNSLLEFSYKVVMAESMTSLNIYQVEKAVVPDKTDSKHKHPDILINFIVALFMGTVFCVGAAFLTEFLDDTIQTSDDIRIFPSVTFLGVILKLKKKQSKLIDIMDPQSLLSETFRTIRNSIRFATVKKKLKSFVVTSSIKGEGKSLFTANVAISIANQGDNTLIIDGNMRRPGQNTYFNLNNKLGLTNYLIGDANVESIQQKTDVERLSVITTGPIPPDPGKLVESEKMHDMVNDMKDIYDVVIIDSPQLAQASDAIIFAGLTDGLVIIVESGKSSRRLFADLLELIKKAEVNILGGVLNKAAGRMFSY